MDKIHLYEGVYYEVPKQPPKSEIAGHELPKKEQRWRRTDLPKEFVGMNSEEIEDYCDQNAWAWEFIKEEERRCTEGYWFYNFGQSTYITGDHYYYLNWFKLDVGYPHYFDKDRRWFYFADFCDRDPDCMGMIYMKKRRDGFSYRSMARQLNRARRTFNGTFGMMSKTGDDAKELFGKVVYAFQEMPAFFKPQVQSAEDVKKELYFKEPIQRVTHKNKSIRRGVSLNTKINYKNTKNNSYDGNKLRHLTGDEVGKFEEANFEKWFEVAKTCLTQGSKIIGKGDFGSTVEESSKGGAAFEAVWKKSCYDDRPANNRTISGLYRYFTPAYDGYEGHIDEYGFSIIDTPAKPVIGIDGELITVGAKQVLEQEREAYKAKGDLVGLYEHFRKFPFDEKDAFRDPANERTVFDLDRIYQQIDYNKSIRLNLRQGNFSWKNGQRDTEVVFHDDPNGKWIISWMPRQEDRNKRITKKGLVAPANTHEGIFSIDPFDHRHTTSGKKSFAGSHGFRKLNLMEPANSHCFISEYYARPSDPAIEFEDMILQCVFYGWEILGESQKPGCINYFRQRGYDNYLSERPAITHTDYSEKNQKEVWLPSTGEAARMTLVENLQSYIYQYIGLNHETGQYGNMPFIRTLEDWAKFDPEDWTDFDLTVSSMVVVVGSRKFVPKNAKKPDMNLWRKYKVVGNESFPI